MYRFFRAAFWLLAAAAWLAFAPHASAQQDEWEDRYYPFAREGLYVGIGGLLALENFDRDAAIEGVGTALEIGADDAGGLELRGGYRAHPNFAGEMLFQFFSGFSVNNRSNGSNDTFNGWLLAANAKGYAMLDRIQPYALAGVGLLAFTEKRGSELGFITRIGGGIDFYLSQSVVLDLEIVYVLPAGSLDDYQFTTFAAGIEYRY